MSNADQVFISILFSFHIVALIGTWWTLDRIANELRIAIARYEIRVQRARNVRRR